MAAPDQGTGTVVTFGQAAYNTGFPVSSLTMDVESEAVETTHLGTTGARDFIQADLINTIISMEIQFDPAITKTNAPWTEPPQTMTIDFGGVAGTNKHVVTGFVASSSIVANVPNQLMTMALTWQCTSVISFA